jgi:hypothetical protein
VRPSVAPTGTWPRADRDRRWRIALASGLSLVLCLACLRPPVGEWGAQLAQPDFESLLAQLPTQAAGSLLPLSEIFYSRITSRRFNSRATFEDPSVRQFFPTLSAYSDYYAALVDALDLAHIKNYRPNSVELLEIERIPTGLLRLEVRFVGNNDLPLRWWSAALVRHDEWQWRDGRWWVVPGKV